MLSADDKKLLTEIARIVNYYPLMLRLANGLIREEVEEYGRPLGDALQFVSDVLRYRGVQGLDADQAIARTLDISLSRLLHDDRRRYLQLAIFPDNAEIPYRTLEKLWSLDVFSIDRLCKHFNRLGLLHSLNQHPNREQTTVRLHDAFSAHLRTLIADQLHAEHRAFLDQVRAQPWADMPADEPYLWDHLFHHLASAGARDELIATIKDVAYVARKTVLRDIFAVEADMLAALALAGDDRQLRLWRRTFAAVANVLKGFSSERDIITNLYSHCAHVEELASLIRDVPYTHLTALHPLPDQPHYAHVRTLEDKAQAIRYAVFSPDPHNRHIAATYANNMIRVWSTHTGKLERVIDDPGDKTMGRCYYSPDGSLFLVAYVDGRVKLWDTETWENLADWQIAPPDTSITKAIFHPDGRTFATIDYGPHTENDIRLWSISNQECVRHFVGHTKALWHIEFTADGGAMVSSSDDHTIRLWDVNTGAELHSVHGGDQPVSIMRFSPDGRYLLCADSAGNIAMRYAASLEEVYRIPNAHRNIIRDVAFSRDGEYFFTGSYDEQIRMWETQTGRPQRTLTGHLGEVRSIQFTHDGSLLMSSSTDGTIRLWNPYEPEHPARDTTNDHKSWVTSCAFSPTGQLVATTSKDRTIKLWDIQTGQVTQTLEGHETTIMACAFHPQYDILISVAGNPRQQDNTLRIWNLTTGAEIGRVPNPGKGWFLDCTFSPDGTLALTTSGDLVDYDNYIHLWDVSQFRVWQQFAGHTEPVYSGTFSSDGRRILTCSSDYTLLIMATENGRRLHQLSGHTDSVYGCALSADGRWIASASADGTARLWDAQTGEAGHVLRGHTNTVWGCAFSPDARYLATASEDCTLKIWSVETGACITTLFTGGFMLKCRWEENGNHIAAVGEKGVYFLRFVEGRADE